MGFNAGFRQHLGRLTMPNRKTSVSEFFCLLSQSTTKVHRALVTLTNRSTARSAPVNTVKTQRNDDVGAARWNCETEESSQSLYNL